MSSTKSKAVQPTIHALSLKEKYEVINTAKNNPGLTSRVLATNNYCSKTQINTNKAAL